MRHPSCSAPRRLFLLSAVLVLTAASARAADVDKAAPSLKLVPADAEFYSAWLGLGEQWGAIKKTRAWAKLTEMDAVQAALKEAQTHLKDPKNPLAKFLADPENQKLLEVLGDMVGREFFVYGAAGFGDFVELLQEVHGAQQFARGFARFGMGGAADANVERARAVLQTLKENKDKLKPPGVVFGFRLDDPKPAQAQLKRLEKLLGDLVEQTEPLKGRFKKTRIGTGDFLVLTLDGKMVPWEQVPFQQFEEQAGEFDDLVKKLKEVRLTISLGVRDGYLLFGLGESTAPVAALGAGKALAGVPELKPLAKHADRRLSSVGYTARSFNARVQTNKDDIEALAEGLKEMLDDAGLNKEQRAKAEKDLADLAKDVKSLLPEPGASLSFSFLTDRGAESYAYDWARHPKAKAPRPLTLLGHVGGSPLLALAGRSGDTDAYKLFSKWVKVADGYLDEVVLPQLDAGTQQQAEKVLEVPRPALRRLDGVTSKMLLPALDGQAAFVLDARLTSRSWHRLMPEAKKPLPLLEPSLVLGVANAGLLEKALGEYREVVNKLIKDVADAAGQGTSFEIPKAKTRKLKGGTLYYHAIPEEVGLDERIVPNVGIGEKAAVFSLSAETAERLLARTPLKDPGLVKADGPLLAATYVNFEELMKALTPWAEYAAEVLSGGMEDEERAKLLKQVRTAIEVMSVFRSYRSVTYVEGATTVTHGESVYRDLGEAP